MNTTSRIDLIAALLGLALTTAFPPGRAQLPATSSHWQPLAASVVEPDAVAALNGRAFHPHHPNTASGMT